MKRYLPLSSVPGRWRRPQRLGSPWRAESNAVYLSTGRPFLIPAEPITTLFDKTLVLKYLYNDNPLTKLLGMFIKF
ncbi:MAG: hypothetical protein ACLRSW_11655 [Christensenellaceae bacterium]